MSKPKSALSATDKALFQAAVQDVTPLRSPARVQGAKAATLSQPVSIKPRRSKPLPVATPTLPDLYELSDPQLRPSVWHDEYVHPRCGTDVLRHLKKGRWPIVHSLDLHGSTLDQARLRLSYFLQHSLVENYKCVRIVHGKGYGSKDKAPVLPAAVRSWLTQLDFVLAFSNCHPHEGGAGAVKIALSIHKN